MYEENYDIDAELDFEEFFHESNMKQFESLLDNSIEL